MDPRQDVGRALRYMVKGNSTEYQVDQTLEIKQAQKHLEAEDERMGWSGTTRHYRGNSECSTSKSWI